MLKRNVNIGFIIHKVFLKRKKENKLTISQFAKALGCDRGRVYDIFENRSIDTELLIRISKILDYSFLLDYFEENHQLFFYLIIAEEDNKKIEEMSNDSSLKVIKLWSGVGNLQH